MTPIAGSNEQAPEVIDWNTVDHHARSWAPAQMATKEDSSNVDVHNGDYDGDDDVHSDLSREREHLTEIRSDRVGDLEDAYEQIFKSLQELSMKAILKEWIKKIEPGKSRSFPYHGGRGLPPKWWPSGVEHVEPDHLKKKGGFTTSEAVLLSTYQIADRHTLAITILRHVMTRHSRHGGIEGLKNSTKNVELRFGNESDEKRTGREQALDQLYNIARREEAHRSGKQGGSNTFPGTIPN